MPRPNDYREWNQTGRNGSRRDHSDSRNNQRRSYDNSSGKIEAKALPDQYVDKAETVISRSGKNITTSKLRNLLSQLVDVYNVENLRSGEKLRPESVNALMLARIRMLYEAGRDRKVKEFIDDADLLPYLKDIGDSRIKMLNYYHYLEALVAYHKYYGGREN